MTLYKGRCIFAFLATLCVFASLRRKKRSEDQILLHTSVVSLNVKFCCGYAALAQLRQQMVYRLGFSVWAVESLHYISLSTCDLPG